ncbi:chorismate mutase [Candidatus Methanosphaera massiliense]|mgnify:CR=1 FL=1|jgi:chorismate mutase|uniref:chorismate mutase n=1 Tax=Methanosphaera TaxID=2316 RepID=UPI00238073D5|nr:chorismate mutase [Candidatus Methanosphaera massiliense]MDE4078063.1 chorismate mutase [Candidatus Methanosphaera massiliense]MDY2744982.1 chorismate mutase [Methanosphaera sp.]
MNKEEAENLLKESRDKIDVLDEQIINLIVKRTSLAYDIAISKKALNKELLDTSRENIIHDKINNLLDGIDIDKDSVIEIFGILASMSKEEQKKYLD